MGQTALSVTSRTYGGCLERCGLGLAPGTGGDSKRIGGHGQGACTCVSVTWSTPGALASRARNHSHLDYDRRAPARANEGLIVTHASSNRSRFFAQIGDRAGGSRVVPSAAASL